MSVRFLQNHFWKLVFAVLFFVVAGLGVAFYLTQVLPGLKNAARAEELDAAGFYTAMDWHVNHGNWSRFEHKLPNLWTNRVVEIHHSYSTELSLVPLSGIHDVQFLTLGPPSNDSHFATLEEQRHLIIVELKGRGFTDESLLHLQKISENGRLPKMMFLSLTDTEVSGTGLLKFFADGAPN